LITGAVLLKAMKERRKERNEERKEGIL